MNDCRDTDLFGHPVRRGKGARGRPPKEWSAQDFDLLEAGLAQGWGNERLAQMLDCGVSTLKRNFGPALRMRGMMPDRVQAAIFAAAVRKAVEKQDMGAVRQVRSMLADAEREVAERRIKEQSSPDEPIGKKEAARRAAADAAQSESWGGMLDPGQLPN